MIDSHIYGNIALVKTTVDLEAGLFKSARKLAIDQGRPFRAVLNDALRAYLGTDEADAASRPGAGAARHQPERRRPRRAAPRLPARNSGPSSTTAPGRDDLFGDRLQKIEDDIARATADWEKRNRG